MCDLDKIIDNQIYDKCDFSDIYFPEAARAKARELVKIKLVALIVSQVSKDELKDIAYEVLEEENK